MYRYDEFDHKLVAERVEQFDRQVKRRLNGELTEDQFKPLRLMNGLYLQLHAYMLRVNVPYGTLSSGQMRRFADIARKYDRGFGHFTTRQNIQYNWIKLEDAPQILRDLADVEVTAIQSSGNCVRNITSDQYAGRAKDELVDPRKFCELLRQYSVLHPEFSYLPRKFKIAVTGSPNDRAAVAVHDIGLRMHENDAGEIGFEVLVGGGLGRTPYIGHTIRAWIEPEHILSYVEAILRVYNIHGRRDNIHKARIKIIVNQMGIEKYRELVEAEWQRVKDGPLAVPDEEIERIERYFAPPRYETLEDETDSLAEKRAAHRAFDRWIRINTAEHKVPGYVIVNVPLKVLGKPPGDIDADTMDAVADLADRYTFGEIRINHRQNLAFVDVRQQDLFELWQALDALGLARPVLDSISDMICCPGLDYCALANARSIPIADDISRRFVDVDELADVGELKINISGCMNACGHHHVGHIGILGVDKRGEEFFQLTLGGSSDQHASLGDRLGPGLPQDEVPEAIAAIVGRYKSLRTDGERFLDTYRRVGIEPFKEVVYGGDERKAVA
ncbi:MAG TPA: nitrite/sulfite reductase [Gammaproteobacteria bacterium]|nr:nitrite/sulfite reductase [Gammaproteobacteria bacterium]